MKNKQFIKVWDIAVGVFNWTLVGCFAIAFTSAEDFRKLHVVFGYSVLFLVLFRISYGFVGTRYARFYDFTPTLQKPESFRVKASRVKL